MMSHVRRRCVVAGSQPLLTHCHSLSLTHCHSRSLTVSGRLPAICAAQRCCAAAPTFTARQLHHARVRVSTRSFLRQLLARSRGRSEWVSDSIPLGGSE